MHLAEEDLIRLALQTLEDAATEALASPVQRTNGVRLALAYLASRSDCERWPFDGFWKWLPYEEKQGRAANVTANINGIYEQIGRKRELRQ